MQKEKKYTDKTVIMENQVITMKAIIEMSMMTMVTMAMERTFLCQNTPRIVRCAIENYTLEYRSYSASKAKSRCRTIKSSDD